LRRAWELQAEDRADFVEFFGADLVVLPPREAQEKLREHYRRRMAKVTGNAQDENAQEELGEHAGPTAEEIGTLPEQVLAADSVALVYDETEGLNYFSDFARLDELFADPTLAGNDVHTALLRRYLADDSISPLAIRRLVQRHPEGADVVFQALHGQPDFSWKHDGETLLRRYKGAHLDRTPIPTISAVGDRLTELLASAT
jgi:hypothetical protein